MSDLYVGEDFRLVKHCIKELYRFWGKRKKRISSDLLLDGFIALKEFKKDNVEFNDVVLMRHVCNVLQKKLRNMNNKCVSLSSPLKRYDNNKCLEDVTSDKKDYFEKYDFEFLETTMNNVLNLYNKETQKVLRFYFFEDNNRVATCKKFKISNQQLGKYVRDFREKFASKLIYYGYMDVLAYINEEVDEFVLDKYHKNAYERLKAKKQGITLYNVNDYQIFKLMRNGNISEYASFLKWDENDLNATLSHAQRSKKLFLYQIQALRKQFFPSYSFNDLVSVWGVLWYT